MKLWLDTINLEVIKKGVKTEVISGVTTNPSILSKSENIHQTLSSILKIHEGPLAIQVTSDNPEEMMEEGRAIFAFSNRCVVKVFVDEKGLIVMKQLSKENIPVMGTGVFTPWQALLAANLGVPYIAPYFSHIPVNPLDSVKEIMQIIRANNYSTKVLVASIKSVEDLMLCAQLGVHAATIKEDLYNELMLEHPLIKKTKEKFSSEWHQNFKDNSIKDLICF